MLEYLKEILSSTMEIDESLTIVVKNTKFLSELESLMQRTPENVLVNYTFWRNVEYVIGFLGGEIRKKYLQFETNVTGINYDRPR